jgi:hypothetical protein
MELSDAGWNGHQWPQPSPRRVEIGPGKLILQRHCIRCGRDFVTEPSSGNRYAVFVSAISFHRLDDEVTERWLKELCLGQRRPGDDEDRKRKIAEFPVFKAPGASVQRASTTRGTVRRDRGPSRAR